MFIIKVYFGFLGNLKKKRKNVNAFSFNTRYSSSKTFAMRRITFGDCQMLSYSVKNNLHKRRFEGIKVGMPFLNKIDDLRNGE